MTSALAPFAGDLSLFVLDDIGVVFSETAQEIHQLNAAATYLWCRIEAGVEASDLPRDLAADFGITLDEAERQLDGILAAWRRRGFFAETPPPRAMAARAEGGPVRSSPEAPSRKAMKMPLAISRSYRVLGRTFRVGFESREIEASVHPMVSHLEIRSEEQGDEETGISLFKEGRSYVVAERGRPAYRRARLEEIAPLVNYLVFTRAVARAGYSVAFHAGAVSDGRRALVLPGDAGSGKTSLTAALVHAGLRYLSDDLVLLRTGRTEIEGVPFSLCVKESGVELLRSRFPDLPRLPAHPRPDGRRVRYLPPPPERFANDRGGARAAWLVFPRYEAGAGTRLGRLSRAEALRRLLKTCTLATPLTRRQVETFIVWLRSVDCMELPMSSLDEAADLLRDLWRGSNDPFPP